MHRRWLLVLFFLLTIAACTQRVAADSGWDDDEQPDSAHQSSSTPRVKTTPPPKRTTLSAILAQVAASKTNWWPEVGMLFVIALFIANYIRGRAINETRAVAWAEAYCTTNSVFDSNFALLGPGDGDDELLIKESQCRYLLYASGRRYCASANATLNLRPRQDLLLSLWGVLFPSKDMLDVEVVMQEGSMPPMVLLIATKKLAKELTKNLVDVESLAHGVEVTRDRLAAFPSDALTVLAEHSSIFYDLMVDDVVQLLFAKGAFAQLQPYFRYLHFTTEHMSDMVPSGRQPKPLLRFSFNLPSANNNMADIARLLQAVMLFIDVVGQYKLGPEQLKRGAKAREELGKEARKEAQEARAAELAKKKAEAKQLEMDKARRAGPAALRKYEEKQQKLETKRAMRARSLKA